MGNQEERLNLGEDKKPLFEAPDGKILAFDPARGAYPGISSDMDLDNPGRNLPKEQKLPD
ncbi:hypothetical protein [Mesobacillus harenae]|uniref:hypothetical protein n=1 Tax=Mesobacillus harenae TaxID=2213203 RepID=UPI00157FDB12|nr:hypothetical protein [Mesobacillus harenae]